MILNFLPKDPYAIMESKFNLQQLGQHIAFSQYRNIEPTWHVILKH